MIARYLIEDYLFVGYELQNLWYISITIIHKHFQDCEAIWNKRDAAVRQLCSELGVTVVEKISHTLWDPFEIIEANGGFPPTTYEMFVVCFSQK